MNKISLKSIKQCVVMGVLLAVIMPAVPALAVDTATVGSDATQTASTGQTADVPDTTVPPSTTDTQTPPTADTTQAEPPAADSSTVPDGTSTPATTETQTDPAATIDNSISSNATSGDANVTNNAVGGDATSGNADAQLTLINMLQTLNNLGGGTFSTFTDNVNGTVNGDLHIDPTTLAQALNNAGISCNGCSAGDISSLINNYVDMAATSGSATVSGNGSGGDANSGNAAALANIINILNSMLVSGNAFIGTINIYGDLNGNIVLPASLVGALSNDSPPTFSPPSGCNSCSGTTTNVGIDNELSLAAQSGDASVIDNHRAGNATSGNALTNLNSLDLINQQIFGSNVLLVFVNVMGKWVGLLMSAPAGSTTALLGNGITQSSSPLGSGIGTGSSTTAQINNFINLSATSGDATVSNNRRGGNATSGNATANLNLLNIVNSQIAVLHWFGVLFINVFGSWNGSLLAELTDGTVTVIHDISDTQAPKTQVAAVSSDVFGFTGAISPSTDGNQPTGAQSGEVLGASTSNTGVSNKIDQKGINYLLIGVLGTVVCFGLLTGIDKFRTRA